MASTIRTDLIVAELKTLLSEYPLLVTIFFFSSRMNNKTAVPVKTFYFGMDINENNCPFAIEAFASQIQHMSQSSSESQISSNDGFTDIIYDEVRKLMQI